MTLKRLVLLPILLATSSGLAAGQDLPSPADVLGHDLGERFTDGYQVVEYAERLSAASPYVNSVRYGETAEGRDLVLLVVSSRANLDNLEDILAANARLVQPGLDPDEANRIARSNPAVVWFTYGVHGDESSSTEAALWTAWDLATERGDVIRDSLVVLIDPNANPDGRERYVAWYRASRGARPDPDLRAREHDPAWPAGRTNHYNFDLNRDWGWGTQAETHARLAEWSRWNPHVHVDFHEMGLNATYFFFPAASPHNPIYPDYTLRWAEYFGSANAAEFDRRRWLYYTEESFDLFYPGYGDSWPSLVGAIGMTFEQAGGGQAGLAVERRDGRVLTLSERASHHRVAGWSTAEAAMARKTDLLMEFAAFHRSQQSGLGDVLLVPGDHREAADALVSSLQRQGIAVQRAGQSFRVASRPHPGFSARQDFPAGTYIVRSNQPRGRLALTLLQPETLLDPEANPTYDIAAWSMPYAYGVEAHMTDERPAGEFEPVSAFGPAGTRGPDEGAYGYLIEPSFGVAGPILRYLASGGRVVALRDPFETTGRSWPAGTYFIPGDDSATVRMREADLSSHAYSVHSGLTAEGHDLGTGRSLTLRAPAVGLLAGPGFSTTSSGAAWFLVERMLSMPARLLDARSVGAADLRGLDVLVLPSGRPLAALDEAARSGIGEWVRDGGTLIAVGGSAQWVGSELAGIEARSVADDRTDEERVQLALRTMAEKRSDTQADNVSGIILPVHVDPAHPLAWGTGNGNFDHRAFVLHFNGLVFEPTDEFTTVVAFEPGLEGVSGPISEERLASLASSAWLAERRLDRGRVILFADDPLFRLMWRSSFQFFVNAILLGPAM